MMSGVQDMNQNCNKMLGRLKAVMQNGRRVVPKNRSTTSYMKSSLESITPGNTKIPRVHVGVDLGTAYTVLIVLDEDLEPLGGEYRFAQIVRDGLVVDFYGAIELVSELKRKMELRLGFELTRAATSFPPGVALAEVKATQNVLIAAGLECENVVDEPTAANAVLQVENGAIVDVGGGTTGIAVIQEGKVVYTGDEPTGGTQFSLVIAGALDKEFEDAEDLKKDPRNHRRLFPIIRPVMEKVGRIVARHVENYSVEALYLVGGTCAFTGIDQVLQKETGLPTYIPSEPMFVTPLGIARHDVGSESVGRMG